MNYENLLYVGIGISTGFILMATYYKIKNGLNRLNMLEDSINDLIETTLDPEEMAQKILTMRMPISKLPPELIQQLKEETEQSGKMPPPEKLNYVG